MARDEISSDELELLKHVFDAWTKSNGDWPTFAEVDKSLDAAGVDALEVLERLLPRYVRSTGSYPSDPGSRIFLTVRALAQLPEATLVTGTFVAVIEFLAAAELMFTPIPPDQLAAHVTSDEFAHFLTDTRSNLGSYDVLRSLAESIGSILASEGHLWTSYSGTPDATRGPWAVNVSRNVRRYRDVKTLDEYLTTTNRMNPQSLATESANVTEPESGHPQARETQVPLYTLTIPAISNSIRDLTSSRIHPFFLAYLHLRQRSVEESTLVGLAPKWTDLAGFLLVDGGPPKKPFYRPFWHERATPIRYWLNENIAGSYAPSSLRQGPATRVVDLIDSLFNLRPGHTELALKHLLYDKPVNLASMAAFLYRDYGFLNPKIEDVVAAFRHDFGFPDTEQGSRDLQTLFSEPPPGESSRRMFEDWNGVQEK